ncbi:MAG: hypothetical protein M0R46_16720 [Candidatus Muirbacterium halophilum]|nr:hypothetical protein [Candidatus Muirbacterium halophilum]
MRYLRNFNESLNSFEIDAICKEYNIKKYTINNDGSIDVNGDVLLWNRNLKVLPLKFRNVNGSFNCGYNKLANLNGYPQHVDDSFHCDDNQLTNLIGAPQYVGDGFYCTDNQLTNLIGAPQYVGGNFSCDDNQLTSLEGAPIRVYGEFLCRNNKLKNIDYLPKTYKKLNIYGNPISKILDLFVKIDKNVWVSKITDKELISEFIDREIIQQDILLVNRLVEFLADIDKPKSSEELIELLKNDYDIK